MYRHDGEARRVPIDDLPQPGPVHTTIYSDRDRFRGVHGTRMVLFINRNDMDRLGLSEGERVSLQTIADDGVDRQIFGLIVRPYNIPEGCLGAYYPEYNLLVPLSHQAKTSKVPAYKGIPVRLHKNEAVPNAMATA